uniref:Uncharacterized protein n=1 Tax=Anguilla anguilla TaxID=7936 RepID=A0A0E9PM29_ANGAN
MRNMFFPGCCKKLLELLFF